MQVIAKVVLVFCCIALVFVWVPLHYPLLDYIFCARFYNPKLYKAAPKRELSEEDRATLAACDYVSYELCFINVPDILPIADLSGNAVRNSIDNQLME